MSGIDPRVSQAVRYLGHVEKRSQRPWHGEVVASSDQNPRRRRLFRREGFQKAGLPDPGFATDEHDGVAVEVAEPAFAVVRSIVAAGRVAMRATTTSAPSSLARLTAALKSSISNQCRAPLP